MDKQKAYDYIIPFGKYAFENLKTIAVHDPMYLDDLVDAKDIPNDLKDALKTILAVPWVIELVNKGQGTKKYSEPVENIRKPKNWWE